MSRASWRCRKQSGTMPAKRSPATLPGGHIRSHPTATLLGVTFHPTQKKGSHSPKFQEFPGEKQMLQKTLFCPDSTNQPEAYNQNLSLKPDQNLPTRATPHGPNATGAPKPKRGEGREKETKQPKRLQETTEKATNSTPQHGIRPSPPKKTYVQRGC